MQKPNLLHVLVSILSGIAAGACGGALLPASVPCPVCDVCPPAIVTPTPAPVVAPDALSPQVL